MGGSDVVAEEALGKRARCVCMVSYRLLFMQLQGNLSPNGAIIKPSAATPSLLQHRGRAVVFESFEEMRAKVDSNDLDIDENCVMVLKGCGPRGYPGFPEVRTELEEVIDVDCVWSV